MWVGLDAVRAQLGHGFAPQTCSILVPLTAEIEVSTCLWRVLDVPFGS